MSVQKWTAEDIDTWLVEKRNWGRWGEDDQAGAVNLITPEKRLAALGLVRAGRTVSMARPISTSPQPGQRQVVQQFGWRDTGNAFDHLQLPIHCLGSTHIDALNHNWDRDGVWNGRRVDEVFRANKASWADVDVWHDGIITRGVLLDVPKHRGTPSVTPDVPVTGAELEAILAKTELTPEPGDALVINCGLEAWLEEKGQWGVWNADMTDFARPGLDVSCLEFIREYDFAVVIADMHDASYPSYSEIAHTVHSMIWAYGVALVDNAQVDRLAEVCVEVGSYEFLTLIAPLRIPGGTGSPVNPLAVF
ncbi:MULTISPECIES: cyclase family protein [unclassified Pseudofrankia]|uniref:cyclase family protein n=1 Tax=unclassified Pseudofrankia TaxID=2994372 RepID=UPI0008D9A020|nr:MULTISPECIES: cyclase family protein [unclassified Pseudofrankia]MDT3445615.1 cyclase family protein [Pseudofrankia sp. BMG5.37]OHV63536.1 hypothetical protein BCD48_38085 [Pseudofrankia sp. BMG5.36]